MNLPMPPLERATILPHLHRVDIWAHVWSGLRVPGIDVIEARDLSQRQRCKNAMLDFKLTYFPHLFNDPNAYHVETNARKQVVILDRSPFVHQEAEAAPRSCGKTTDCRITVVWATPCYEHVDFSLFLTANGDKAKEHIKAIKHEFLTNDKLAADFPEICGWVRSFGGDPRRCKIMYPNCEWSDNELCFPSGVWICAYGMDSALPGMNKNGKRPKLIIFDDIETISSIRSESETEAIDQRMRFEAMKLHDSGHRAIYWYICTIHAKKCISARVTDPRISPEWRGRRYKAMTVPPERTDLWDKFMDLCQGRFVEEIVRSTVEEACAKLDILPAAFDLFTPGYRDALRFYVARKPEMDAGAQVLDSKRMPLHVFYAEMAKDEEVTLCELQNDPPENINERTIQLDVEYLMGRRVGEAENIVPQWSKYTLATVDVGAYGLHWEVDGWDSGVQTSALITQGVQETNLNSGGRFKMEDNEARKKIMAKEAVWWGLEQLYLKLSEGLPRSSGELVVPALFGFDCGGTAVKMAWFNTVLQFCATHARCIPLKGQAPWRAATVDKAQGRHFFRAELGNRHDCDVDEYKTRQSRALQAPLRDRDGSIYRGSRVFHLNTPLVYCKHLTAEWFVESISEDAPAGKAIKVGWNQDGTKPNHWWDTGWMQFALADILRVRGVAPAQRRAIPRTNPNEFNQDNSLG